LIHFSNSKDLIGLNQLYLTLLIATHKKNFLNVISYISPFCHSARRASLPEVAESNTWQSGEKPYPLGEGDRRGG